MDKYISNKIKNISLIMTFFVVILHSNNLEDPSVLNINTLIQNFIGQGIVRIAVPMFFLISGYLFFYKFKPSKEAFLNKYKKRFKSLFIPYFLWCTGWLVILYLVELTSFGRAMFSDRIVAIKLYCLLNYMTTETEFKPLDNKWLAEQIGLSSKSKNNLDAITEIVAQLELCGFIETKKENIFRWDEKKGREVPQITKSYRLRTLEQWQSIQNKVKNKKVSN